MPLRATLKQGAVRALQTLRDLLAEEEVLTTGAAFADPLPPIRPRAAAPEPIPEPVVAQSVLPPPSAVEETIAEAMTRPVVDVDAPPAAESDAALEARVEGVLRTIYDPEIPVDIFELGLIYGIEASPEGNVTITMTLTSPNCPAAQSLPGEVEMKVGAEDGVADVVVDVVWDPPWSPERMSEEARLELNL